jgi:predicted Zn-ribbon and HTH transcriptional regulator
MGTWTAREISGEIGLSEKEVYDHLAHIRRSAAGAGHLLFVTPAECRKCGYRFVDRDRLTKPGRCPSCRGEAIHPPSFSIVDR